MKSLLGTDNKITLILKILTYLSLASLVGLIFWRVSDLSTLDLGRHLQNGALVFKNPSLLFSNFYSYTNPGFPFVNHHWLAGLIYYGLYLLGGFKILTVFNVSLALATVLIFFWISQKRSHFFIAALSTLLTLIILSERADIRPEMFSYLFLALTFYFLDNYRTDWSWRRLIWLPLLFLVWVNTHIYFAIGLALVAFKFLELIIHKFNFKDNKKFFYLSGLSIVACLFNPNFIKGLLYPLLIFKNYGYEVAENKSILFIQNLTLDHNIIWFKILFLIFCLSWFIYFWRFKKDRLKKFRFSDLMLSIFVSCLAWRAIRYLPLFSLLITPILAQNLSLIKFNKFKKINFGLSSGRLLSLGLSGLVIVSGILIIYLVKDSKINHYFLRQDFGLGLSSGVLDSANFFAAHNLSGPIFNDYDLGSFLIFALPGGKVFVDNSPEAYPREFFTDVYVPLQDNDAKWREYKEKYKFQTIYLSHQDNTPWARKFLRARLADPDWSLVYFDYYTVILVPSAKQAGLSREEIRSRLEFLSRSVSARQKLVLANLAELDGDIMSARQIYNDLLIEYPNSPRLLALLYFNYVVSDSVGDKLMA
ncbi:MAG: hypothetical protein NTX66_04545, partial [Candidatus Falkowbacteria bacterium]|nr:hypothetical protein [Candidatus Falkowbacteria bacterium]